MYLLESIQFLPYLLIGEHCRIDFLPRRSGIKKNYGRGQRSVCIKLSGRASVRTDNQIESSRSNFWSDYFPKDDFIVLR